MSLADVKLVDPTAAWAIARTLPLEGGLVDNPNDPGGVTDYGISLRWALAEVQQDPDALKLLDVDHDRRVTRDDVRGLTPDLAADIYYRCWWQPGWYGQLTPALVAWKCFDVAVNTGPTRSALLLQRALVDCGSGVDVDVDGHVGPATVAAVAVQCSRDQGLTLMSYLRREQAQYYRTLAVQQPKLSQFLKGWLNRAAA